MYREILVYTSTGDTARRMSEYAAGFASTLKARLAGLVVDVDFVERGGPGCLDRDLGWISGALR